MPATIAGNDDVVDQERLNETKILTKWNDMLLDKNIIIDNYSIVKDFDDEVSTYFIDASVNIDDDINIQGNDKNIIQADYLFVDKSITKNYKIINKNNNLKILFDDHFFLLIEI